MDLKFNPKTYANFLYVSLSILSIWNHYHVSYAGATNVETTTSKSHTFDNNPFTPKSFSVRFWNKQITNNHPIPYFLYSKLSPLNAVDYALFTKLAYQNSLSSHLQPFCLAANLFCSFDDAADSDDDGLAAGQRKPPPKANDANFAVYSNKRFTNYGTSRLSGTDSFKNYSQGLNTPTFSFKKYTKDATGHGETFTHYGTDGNVANGSFGNYGFGANGGTGIFQNYQSRVNVPNSLFTTYSSGGNGHKMSFGQYSDDTNTGQETFTSYGKSGNHVPSEFTNYGHDSNTMASTFTGYGVLGNNPNQSFVNYGEIGNDPHSNFKTYSTGGNSATDSFVNYRNGANVGENSFQSYARDSISAKASFVNYGKSFNPGNDTFKEYGKGSKGQLTIGFKSYSVDRSFKDYAKTGVTFAGYSNVSVGTSVNSSVSGIVVNKWVEPGRFFRESMLEPGRIMTMPDIRDKMPKRSFLPRAIASKLPPSTSSLGRLLDVFHVRKDSDTDRVIIKAIKECEREPSPGETKRCVGSAEDMIDFAVSVLGHDIEVRTTENVNGATHDVMIGSVKGINGGRLTKSVSCHQSLYPYLLYYCHSVPKVRVYEADILNVETKSKINHGVAICHLDTSAWSRDHGAFVALGYGPGQIEVCHWIFENDMTWTVADH